MFKTYREHFPLKIFAKICFPKSTKSKPFCVKSQFKIASFYHKHFVSLTYGHFFKLFLEALYKKYAQTYGTWLSLLFDFTKTILSSSFDISSSNIKIKLKQQISGVGWLIVGGQCGVWSLNQCFTIIYLHIDTETFF